MQRRLLLTVPFTGLESTQRNCVLLHLGQTIFLLYWFQFTVVQYSFYLPIHRLTHPVAVAMGAVGSVGSIGCGQLFCRQLAGSDKFRHPGVFLLGIPFLLIAQLSDCRAILRHIGVKT